MRFQRVYGNARLLDGIGPSLRNISIIDHGCLPMVAHMQSTGLQVDLSHFAKMEIELTQDLERITEEVRNDTGYYCNLDSGDQTSDLLFKKLGLKQLRPKMTKSGDRESVEDEVLTAIQHDHIVVPKILNYKELSKLKGTYVTPMPGLARRTAFGEWRMYPNMLSTRIPSSRFNCKAPNLLAMPTRTERGRDIRKGFITKSDWVYLSCDFSQLEPRVAAHRSQDPGLMNVYLNNEDIYSDFATAAFKLEDKRYFDKAKNKWIYPTVNKDEHRRPSKTCVLAAFYDVTAKGLAEQLPVVCRHCKVSALNHNNSDNRCRKFESLWTENLSQDLLNAFYLKYPGVMHQRKRDHMYARKYGYIIDFWGRLLHVSAVRSVLDWVVSAALREVGNFPMQSGATGLLKLAMAALFDDIESAGMLDLVNFCLPIHDELLLTTRKDIAHEVGSLVVDRFENVCRLLVPIKAEWATADSWGLIPK